VVYLGDVSDVKLRFWSLDVISALSEWSLDNWNGFSTIIEILVRIYPLDGRWLGLPVLFLLLLMLLFALMLIKHVENLPFSINDITKFPSNCNILPLTHVDNLMELTSDVVEFCYGISGPIG
jgi:hypothetical protein